MTPHLRYLAGVLSLLLIAALVVVFWRHPS